MTAAGIGFMILRQCQFRRQDCLKLGQNVIGMLLKVAKVRTDGVDIVKYGTLAAAD